MAYRAVWDFGGSTFSDGTNEVTFDEAIGTIRYTKQYSSQSRNERTGEIILGTFLGWQTIVTISGIYNLEDGDADKINTLQTILESEACTIKPRDSELPNISTVQFDEMILTSSFELEDIAKTNVGQKIKTMTFERLIPAGTMSQLLQNTNLEFYVDENGDYYVDEDGNYYLGG